MLVELWPGLAASDEGCEVERGEPFASPNVSKGMSALMAMEDESQTACADVHHQDPDVQAMLRLRDGDDSALDGIVERYQNELVGYFYHHCWDQLTAEDLAQTVFIKLYRARERYQVSAKLRTYLYRIAHNAWVDHLRRLRPHASLDAEMGAEGMRLGDALADHKAHDPSEMDQRAYLRQRIQDAVENLPEGQRDVFVLANHQEMRYHEIAEVLAFTGRRQKPHARPYVDSALYSVT